MPVSAVSPAPAQGCFARHLGRRPRHVAALALRRFGSVPLMRSMFSRKLPLWYQLSQILRSEILGGQLAPASQIAPEVQLAKRYGVSVITVRQALKSLEADGLISRHRGRGTFVSPTLRTRKELQLIGSVETIITQP